VCVCVYTHSERETSTSAHWKHKRVERTLVRCDFRMSALDCFFIRGGALSSLSLSLCLSHLFLYIHRFIELSRSRSNSMLLLRLLLHTTSLLFLVSDLFLPSRPSPIAQRNYRNEHYYFLFPIAPLASS